LICPKEAYSIIHLFLHDYEDTKVLSFCGGTPFFVMSEQDVWKANKQAISTYVAGNKNLKLIWERDPKTESMIKAYQSLRDLGTEDSLSFSFGGRTRTFYVLNIPNNNIRQLKKRVKAFPATPATPVSQLGSAGEGVPTMFEGGAGPDDGQFDSPAAIAVDASGNVFVADTGNGRIEKFSPTGAFLAGIGTKGSDHGQFSEPSGIAVDRAGNIYVAEIGSKHRIQKLGPDGTFIAEWAPGLYGPRRIAIGPDDSIYVDDSGRNRIVKFSPDGQLLASWGSEGSSEGQFKGVSSVAVDPANNKVYVADPLNSRIQVFDSNGKFLTKWAVPEWGQTLGFEDLAVDSQKGRLYASSAHMNSVLIFDFGGTKIGSLTPKPPDKLDGPSALAIADRKLYVLNMRGSRVSVIDL
jgi:DNA-binding beta-propeller fold protein YncE